MQRGFAPIIILVGILVIIAVAGGAYYFGKSQSIKPETTSSSNAVVTSQTPQPTAISQTTPTPSPSSTDETVNWKTYTNVQYNFSLKYPATFNLDSEDWKRTSTIDIGTLVGNVNFVHDVITNNVTHDRLTLGISVTKTSLSLNDVVKTRCNGYFGDKFSLCTLTDKQIIPDSLQFFDNAHYRGIYTILTHDNLLFEIGLSDNNPDRPFTKDEVNVYNKILSTFKFTQ